MVHLRQALLRLAAFAGAARRACFSARSRLVDLTEQLRWGMLNGASAVLSATNAFESQNTVGMENWEGARLRKIPTLRAVSRRVGKVN